MTHTRRVSAGSVLLNPLGDKSFRKLRPMRKDHDKRQWLGECHLGTAKLWDPMIFVNADTQVGCSVSLAS